VVDEYDGDLTGEICAVEITQGNPNFLFGRLLRKEKLAA